MIERAVLRGQPLPGVATSADESLTERVLLAITAAVAAVLVPGLAGRLIDTPLTWADLGRAVRRQRRRRARIQIQARALSLAPLALGDADGASASRN